MATFLDTSFFYGLTPVFIFLLTFSVTYGILTGTKLLGNQKSLNAIIAFVIAIIISLNEKTIRVILALIPWFTLLFIFLILLILAFKVFGVGDESILAAGKDNTVRWTLIIVSLIILLGALSSAFGQEQLTITKTGEVTSIQTAPEQSPTIGQTDLYAVNGSLSDKVAIGRPAGELKTNTKSFNYNLAATFYHPRVLGFILLMIIGIMTVSQLTKTAS